MLDDAATANHMPDDDDPRRLAAALGYLFTPVVPLVNLSGPSANDRWLRYHAVQALVWSGPFAVLFVGTLLALILLTRSNVLFICLMPLLIVAPFLPGAFWARKIYLGGEVSIPIIANQLTSPSDQSIR